MHSSTSNIRWTFSKYPFRSIGAPKLNAPSVDLVGWFIQIYIYCLQVGLRLKTSSTIERSANDSGLKAKRLWSPACPILEFNKIQYIVFFCIFIETLRNFSVYFHNVYVHNLYATAVHFNVRIGSKIKRVYHTFQTFAISLNANPQTVVLSIAPDRSGIARWLSG